MSKLKVIIVFVVIVGAVFAGWRLIDQGLVDDQELVISSDSCVVSNEVTLCQDADKTFQIAIFKHDVEIAYTDQEAPSIKDQSSLNNWLLAVNGSYFRGSYVDSEHAGLLQINGEPMYQIANGDKQLTHVAVYDAELSQFQFLPVNDFDPSKYRKPEYTLFQTGPLMIKDNQVQTELITTSTNGAGRYLRTVLGYTDRGEKFLAITKSKYDLRELAAKLLSLNIFRERKLNVINLDGGTSTAMYSSDVDRFNFGTSKRLPSVIGVKLGGSKDMTTQPTQSKSATPDTSVSTR